MIRNHSLVCNSQPWKDARWVGGLLLLVLWVRTLLPAAELPALGYKPDPSEPAWAASWIWLGGEEWTVNVHLQARKEFSLTALPQRAALRITSYTDYVLYLNGRRVGRGPEWNDPQYQTYDVYDVTPLLRVGVNVIAVVAHNYAIGVHWSNRGRGGLIAQLDLDNGRQAVVTDGTWKMRKAEGWAANTPRIFWSAGFLETFDFKRSTPGWLEAGFDDITWSSAQVLGKCPARPWIRLLRRQIPLLEEKLIPATGVEKGRFKPPPVHVVRFDQMLPPGRAGIVYAQTVLTAASERTVVFRVPCDDAFRLFLNGELVASLDYSEQFARTRIWRGKDEYDQAHYGMGDIQYGAGLDQINYGHTKGGILRLKKGENRLLMVVDQGPGGWGFLLSFLDPVTRAPIDLDFGTSGNADRMWLLAGPYDTTGLNDSLDRVVHDLETLRPSKTFSYSPFDYAGVTDYATLMEGEARSSGVPLQTNEVSLSEGEYAIFDLGNIYAGFPEFEIDAQDGGILDFGYTQLLTPDRRVQHSAYGDLRYVDRVLFARGRQTWQPYERRTGRYLHISCRRGQAVRIHARGIFATGYPVQLLASFESSDPLLNKIWETSVFTTRLVMQQGYQDCLKREQGTMNTGSFNYASEGAAYSFGDFALARKNLLQAIRTQNDTGWFDSEGVSSPNSDVPTMCLWWAIWLKDYYLLSGDLDFVREVYEGLEDNLRYFTKGINHHGLIEGKNLPIFWRGQEIWIDDTTGIGKYDGPFEGELVGYNMVYAAALRSAGFLAVELGLKDRADLYERRAARVQESLDSRFWDDKRQLFRDWRLGDQLASTYSPVFQITALHFDLAKEERKPRLLSYLLDELGLPDENRSDYPLETFNFYHYFLDVLFRNGRDQEALTLMRRYYGRWLKLGATTFGESFRLADYKGKSALDEEYEVHAYGTSALSHFYSNLLGVRPVEAGFRKVLIAPHPGDLQWARGKLSTPKGLAEISWTAGSGVFQLDARLPRGSAFEVQPPKGFRQYVVHVNGKSLPVTGPSTY